MFLRNSLGKIPQAIQAVYRSFWTKMMYIMIFSVGAFLDMFLSNNSTDDVMMCVMTVTMTLKQGIRGDSRKKKRARVWKPKREPSAELVISNQYKAAIYK